MRIKNLILIFSLTFSSFIPATSQQVFEWRNNRTGIYQDKNLLKTWPATGPELVWEYQGIGNGYGSPVFTNDRMYILGEIDSLGYLFAFDLKGNLLWKSDYGKEWVKTFRGSRSTPTVVDNLIYVCSGLGNLTCFGAEKGDKKWSVDMLKDLHGNFTLHGHSESPAVDGDKVFLTSGGKDTNIVAFDRFTGKIKWICKGLGERPAYNSPAIIHLKDKNLLVTFTAYALLGIDTKTGELMWTHLQNNTPIEKRELGIGDTHSNTGLYDNGFLYYIAGDGNCAVKLKLSDDGKSITEIWRNNEPDNFMGGLLVYNNFIYTSGTYDKDLKAIDTNTGQTSSQLMLGSGATIMDDGLIYFYSQKGVVSLVDPNPEEMKLLSSFKITKGSGEHFSHPVINNGKLYIRHGNTIMAYSITK